MEMLVSPRELLYNVLENQVRKQFIQVGEFNFTKKMSVCFPQIFGNWYIQGQNIFLFRSLHLVYQVMDFGVFEGELWEQYILTNVSRMVYDPYNYVQVIMTHAVRPACYGREKSVAANLLVRVFVLLCTEQWPPEAATER